MRKSGARYRVISAISVTVVLGLYIALSLSGAIHSAQFPSAQSLVQSFADLLTNGYSGTPFYQEVLASLARALAGFIAAVVVGVPFGLLIGVNKTADAIAHPFLSFFRPIPPIALIPLFILYFGIGEVAKVGLIFLTAFWYMTLNAAAGVRGVPEDLVRAAGMLGLNRRQIMMRVVFPCALPQIITGMRVSMALCWALVVAAELIAAQTGLGFMIMDATTFFRIPIVFIGVAVIGVIGLILEASLGALERWLLHWQGK
ncbi:MAG: ABC transporter permease [Candidimonas sp.]|nr:MAG: ABC transporter permease [Candidimonas sp.]